MPIVVHCTCGTSLRARDEQAGRSCRCPRCGNSLNVPYPVARVVEPPPPHAPRAHPTQELQAADAIAAALARHRSQAAHGSGAGAAPAPSSPKPPPPVALSELQRCERTFRGHLYWVLLLFVIPLVYMTFAGKMDPDTIRQKVLQQQSKTTPDKTTPDKTADEDVDPAEKFVEGIDDIDAEEFEQILASFPGKRIEGAFLARDSWGHWLFAIAGALVFFLIVAIAIPCDATSPGQLVLAGLFTATLGVALLLTFQYFGMCFCLIGIWYIAALDPSAPFGPSLLGFILGVGVAEEITKCIPVLWRIHRQDIDWRAACLIGMASGAGFGISEGVHYCTNYYNGIAPLSIYLVRFVSSCGLHVLLSGACGIMIFRKQKHLDDWWDPYDWVLTMTALMIVPICLHGLFNALLKVEMDGAALGVWLAAFAWLAWMINRCRKDEEKAAVVAVTTATRFVKTEKGTRYVGSDPI